MMTKQFALVVVSAGLFAAATMPSRAADPDYCAQYARLAIHEVQVNMATPGCFKGFDRRWNLNYDQHYQWCLTVPYAVADTERDYRRMRVAQCQGR
jgi:hypothetical protein